MSASDQSLVRSKKSQRVLVDGLLFGIEIFQPAGDASWTLEVVDPTGVRHVWDTAFRTEKDAQDAAFRALTEGVPAVVLEDGPDTPR